MDKIYATILVFFITVVLLGTVVSQSKSVQDTGEQTKMSTYKMQQLLNDPDNMQGDTITRYTSMGVTIDPTSVVTSSAVVNSAIYKVARIYNANGSLTTIKITSVVSN
jgi:uncharacterized phosphosugar-binding protein